MPPGPGPCFEDGTVSGRYNAATAAESWEGKRWVRVIQSAVAGRMPGCHLLLSL